jgi:peptide/nickel transport system permease protein
MKRRRLCLGLFMISLVCLTALLGPYLARQDPYRQDLTNTLREPGPQDLLGTDHLGRSVFSRLASGTRYSLIIAASCVGLSLVVGAVLGLAAGYRGQWVDGVIMRLVDAALAFPGTLLAIVLAGLLGGSMVTLILALAATLWCDYCRLARNITRSLKTSPHVEAGTILGFRSPFIIQRYVVPDLAPQLLVLAGLDMGRTILNISSLGFLGIGLRPPTPEWGAMINQGISYLAVAPWLTVAPGLMIFTAVFGFQLLAGALGVKDKPSGGPVGNT